jgi:hypothetical protein
MLLPLAEVIPAWPWQARQFSSCLRGIGNFACARASTDIGPQTERKIAEKSKANKTKLRGSAVFAACPALFPKLRLDSKCFTPNLDGFAKKLP